MPHKSYEILCGIFHSIKLIGHSPDDVRRVRLPVAVFAAVVFRTVFLGRAFFLVV